MKLVSNSSIELKCTSGHSVQSNQINSRGQMIAPGGSCCTLGCSCSCSCGATKK